MFVPVLSPFSFNISTHLLQENATSLGMLKCLFSISTYYLLIRSWALTQASQISNALLRVSFFFILWTKFQFTTCPIAL